MSLPTFDPQTPLFSLATLAGPLFAEGNRFRLFAEKIYPRLVRARSELAACYCADNGRPAVEPVLATGGHGVAVSGECARSRGGGVTLPSRRLGVRAESGAGRAGL